MTDPAMPPPPAAPATSAPMSGMLAKLSQAELLVAGGALLIVVVDVIFGLITRDYSVGAVPWAAATVALFAIVALRFRGMTLPLSHEAILVMAGFVMLFVAARDLLYDLRYVSGNSVDTMYYVAMTGYYVGAALMFVGAWMLWRRRPA